MGLSLAYLDSGHVSAYFDCGLVPAYLDSGLVPSLPIDERARVDVVKGLRTHVVEGTGLGYNIALGYTI